MCEMVNKSQLGVLIQSLDKDVHRQAQKVQNGSMQCARILAMIRLNDINLFRKKLILVFLKYHDLNSRICFSLQWTF